MDRIEGERITAAACRVKFIQPQDGKPSELVLFTPRPGRHHNVFWANAALLGPGEPECHGRIIPPDAEQGFVTSAGRFVDRKEGYHIAQAAGQIIMHGSSCPGTLYSEDLW